MEELTLFEEALADAIQYWQQARKDPHKSLEQLKGDAAELRGVATKEIPCWRKFRSGGPFSFDDGLMRTPMGTAIIHKGSYVILEDLIELLPKIVDEP